MLLWLKHHVTWVEGSPGVGSFEYVVNRYLRLQRMHVSRSKPEITSRSLRTSVRISTTVEKIFINIYNNTDYNKKSILLQRQITGNAAKDICRPYLQNCKLSISRPSLQFVQEWRVVPVQGSSFQGNFCLCGMQMMSTWGADAIHFPLPIN